MTPQTDLICPSLITIDLIGVLRRSSLSHPGKDLIGVQNLLKKHKALQAEITGHEPRIKAVIQKGQAVVENGKPLSFIFPDLTHSVWTIIDKSEVSYGDVGGLYGPRCSPCPQGTSPRMKSSCGWTSWPAAGRD